MQLLSVIVPALNEQDLIGDTLNRIMDQSGLDEVDVWLVDGGSTDLTAEIASRWVPVLRCQPGRAHQMNLGSRHALGDVILYCHADTVLPKEFGLAIRGAMDDEEVVGGAFTPRYRLDHPLMRLAEAALGLPTWLLMFGDQALFARRSALESIGYYPPIPLMEDVSLVRALRQRGRLARLEQTVQTSPRRFLERGVMRQLLLDMGLYIAYWLGVPSRQLAPYYTVTQRDGAP